MPELITATAASAAAPRAVPPVSETPRPACGHPVDSPAAAPVEARRAAAAHAPAGTNRRTHPRKHQAKRVFSREFFRRSCGESKHSCAFQSRADPLVRSRPPGRLASITETVPANEKRVRGTRADQGVRASFRRPASRHDRAILVTADATYRKPLIPNKLAAPLRLQTLSTATLQPEYPRKRLL
jgi:hypothetical protein